MSALFGLVAQTGFDGDHMNGWGGLVIVAMVVLMGGMGWMMWSMIRGTGSGASSPAEDPVEVLKTRYARGELTTEAFEERLRHM